MPTIGKPNPTLDLYAGLMGEVKLRILSIDTILSNAQALMLPPAIAQEFGFLQLRMACEVIALACLVANGDIKATQAPKLMKQYAADKIMEELEKLHPKFFPRPITVTRIDSNEMHIADRKADALEKSEFSGLYGRCGDFLHRGTAKKLLAARQPIQVNFPELQKWRDKVVALLDCHHIASHDNQRHILCNMEPPGRPPSAAWAEAPRLLPRPSESRGDL